MPAEGPIDDRSPEQDPAGGRREWLGLAAFVLSRGRGGVATEDPGPVDDAGACTD